ncbi:type VI secretion system membrane subunit TssM [Providencia sp. PROV236]|uniref:type VI secretion system membrane subunit TssM n=1 Tax=Providencia sp. PROV236 TaxID=2936798 RepID=UPI0034E21167
MKLSFLSIPKITGSLKKLFFGDKSKIKSFLLLCLALIPAILIIWIWWWGPEFRYQDDYPLKELSARWLATIVIVLVIVSWIGYATWKRVKKLESLKLDVELAVVDPVRHDIDFQNRYLDYWKAQFTRHLNGHTNSVYLRPWYFVLGDNESGKQTLLKNSLNTLDIAPTENVVSDHKLPIHIQCLLADNAVLFVPDGKLLTQPMGPDDKPQLYHRLWNELLDWLNTNRSRQPMNGIVLTIDTLALLTNSKEKNGQLIADLHMRIEEVRMTFNSQLPLYIVFTKLDLLRGFDAMFQSLDAQQRSQVLGISFSAKENANWEKQLNAFWTQWVSQMNSALPEMMLNRPEGSQRSDLFSFVRQIEGLQSSVTKLISSLIANNEQKNIRLRGVYLTSATQVGQIDDVFSQTASVQYHLPTAPLTTWPIADTHPYFTQNLFSDVLFSEPNLAAENHYWLKKHRTRLLVASAVSVVGLLVVWNGWSHYYNKNYRAGENVLNEVKSFRAIESSTTKDVDGSKQLPVLNPLREATLAYGNHREKSGLLSEMGLYQGQKVGPQVESVYLQLLTERFLPAIMAGLLTELNSAEKGSEEKLEILRVMRMLEDKSGRNNGLVEDYMANYWSQIFTGQRDIQSQLRGHLHYALEHTDWQAERNSGSAIANKTFAPFAKPISDAQKELSALSLYQRVYQTLKLKANQTLSSPLNLRHQIGPGFNSVFTAIDEDKLEIPQFLTRSGLINYFIRQNDELVDLTLLDAWVLNLARNTQYSDSDRKEIQRQISEQYLSDYTAQWRGAMSNLEIREFDTIQDEINALEQIISGEQPLRRALQVLRDNTSLPAIDSALSSSEQKKLMEEPKYKLLSRLDREFSPETEILVSNNGENLQNLNQKLNDLHRYLLSIQNSPVPGKAALKAVSMRLNDNNRDVIFELSQMAKTLPEPLNRWVGDLADQAWNVVQKEAIRYMEVEWNENVVKQYNAYIAGRYPFNPKSTQDVPLSEFERFFKPNGTIDSFYQQNLRLFVENNLIENIDGQSLIRPDVLAQIEVANRIRDTFFTAQGNLETQFAVEPLSLSGNKRRSILNLDGQIIDYSHGRSNTVHMVWPNSMRSNIESKLTLVPLSGDKSPRALSFSGPWAQLRLIDSGKLMNVKPNSFDVRFSIDGGDMTYRVQIDESNNPFFGGLFTRFRLPETLY